MTRTTLKSNDEIIHNNLKRMLSKLKTRVAESEEIWLEMYQEILPLVIGDEIGTRTEWWESKVKQAALITDVMLSEYEKRWGGEGEHH